MTISSVKLKVVALRNKTLRRAKRGQKAIEPGVMLYVLRNEKDGMFFTFAYTNKATAEKVANRLNHDTTFHWDFNRVPDGHLASPTALVIP